MVTLDPASRVVSANVAFENLFLLPREEAIGRDLDELIAPPERHEEARLLTQRTQLGEQLRVDVRRRRRDGVEVLVLVHSSPIVLDGLRAPRITRKRSHRAPSRPFSCSPQGSATCTFQARWSFSMARIVYQVRSNSNQRRPCRAERAKA